MRIVPGGIARSDVEGNVGSAPEVLPLARFARARVENHLVLFDSFGSGRDLVINDRLNGIEPAQQKPGQHLLAEFFHPRMKQVVSPRSPRVLCVSAVSFSNGRLFRDDTC